MRIRRNFTALYPFCPSFPLWTREPAFPVLLVFRRKTGFEVGLSKRAWPRSISLMLPTLRFRAKVMLGFAVVLTVSAASMGIAYLGFERGSAGVASYRNSVSEADLARNIDRELISYRALARYYVVTGKEEDGKAALAAEASLKDAIDQSMKGTANPARHDQIAELAREFRTFAGIFADILKAKQESGLSAENQLARSEMSLYFKLDDLASAAAEAELPAVEFGAKQVAGQFQAIKELANTFVINGDYAVATSAVARLDFAPKRTARDTVERRKDQAGHQGDRFAVRRLPELYRQDR
jgi:CHASE3 domain sensor protein